MFKIYRDLLFRYIFLAVFASLFFVGVFLFQPAKTKAAGDHLVINEIYAVSSSSSEKDWIEIFNPTDGDINLTGYFVIDDETSSHSFNLVGSIGVDQYLVVEKGSGGFSFDLSSTSEVVFIKNVAGIVDQVEYGDDPSAPSGGKSLQRIPNGSDTDDDQYDFRILAPSKGIENTLPVYSDNIIINEIVPQPDNGSANEFVELYNFGADNVDISGWQIDDIANGGSSPFTIPDGTIIPAGGYLAFYNSDTGISFNDSGDSVRLIDPNGEEKDKIDYSSSNRGQSYSKFDYSWQWTLSLTPNAQNVLTLESPQIEDVNIEELPEITIAAARSQEVGTTVKIRGIVTVIPGTLSSQYFYIQDASGGIQIYSYGKLFPMLKIGDEIIVVGELADYSGEARLKISKISDITIVSTRPPPEPEKIKIDDIGENQEGEYISVIGTVTKTSGNTFYIHGSGEIQVVIRESTGIKKPKMKVGDKVLIAGILSQYKDSFRILPTTQNDVKIISSTGLPNSGSGVLVSIIISAVLSWIINQTLFRRRKNWQKFS